MFNPLIHLLVWYGFITRFFHEVFNEKFSKKYCNLPQVVLITSFSINIIFIIGANNI